MMTITKIQQKHYRDTQKYLADAKKIEMAFLTEVKSKKLKTKADKEKLYASKYQKRYAKIIDKIIETQRKNIRGIR
jgi:ribosomal protein L22